MRIKITNKDVIWNYLGVITAMGSNFLILPFMIYFLEGDLLGLWYVFLSIGGIVTLFDFGFNPTMARNVAYSWSGANKLKKVDSAKAENKSNPNILLLKKVISTSKRIYFIISLTALVILLTLGTFYIIYISDNINGNKHIIAWFIYCIGVYLNLYYGYYSALLRGVGAISKINIAKVISRVSQIVFSVVLLFLGFQIIGVALAFLSNGIIFRTLCKVYFYNHENIGSLLKNETSLISSEDIKETFYVVWHNAWRDGLVSLSAYLTDKASVLICSIFLSLTSTGIYSISIQMITAVASIAGALYSAYQPSLQASYVNKDISNLKTLMSKAMTIYHIVYWLGILGLIFVGIPILNLIKSNIEFNIPVLVALAIYIFLLKHHSYYASFISNTNNVPYMVAFITSSLGGLILSICLIQFTHLGVWGIVFGQILVQAVYNNWKWPKRVLSFLGIHYLDTFKIGIFEIKVGIFKRYRNTTSH